MLSEYITSLADVSFHVVASLHERFRYSGKNPMRFAVFWRISMRFCGFRTPLTPPSTFPNGNYAVMQPAHSLFQKFKRNLSFNGHNSFRYICCRRFFQTVPLYNFRNDVLNVVIHMRYFVYCTLERLSVLCARMSKL